MINQLTSFAFCVAFNNLIYWMIIVSMFSAIRQQASFINGWLTVSVCGADCHSTCNKRKVGQLWLVRFSVAADVAGWRHGPRYCSAGEFDLFRKLCVQVSLRAKQKCVRRNIFCWLKEIRIGDLNFHYLCY